VANIAELTVKVGADITGALSGFSRVESAMGAMGSGGGRALGALGTAAAASGALVVGAAAAAGAAGVKMAGDLEQAVANISTIKPDIDTSAVFASLNEMSTRIPQSAAQLGDALYNVFSSLDVTTEQGTKLVEQFAQGAVGAQTDAQTFGTAIMGVMNAYGTSVEDASHISDVFFNTVNKGVVTGQELAASLGPVTQSAKAAGVDINTLGAMIAGVTKEGGPAAQNINNLNNLFEKVTTKEAQKAIHDLGVKTKDAQGNFRPILDVMGDLKGKLGGMTESARALALQGIFPDAQARQGAQTIISQLDFVKDALNENITTTGSAASAYEKMSATFNSQTKLLENTFNAMLTTVGAAILPHLTPLITALAQGLPGAFAAIQTAAAPAVAFLQGSVLPVFASIAGTLAGMFKGGEDWVSFGDAMMEVGRIVAAALPGIVTQLQAWGQAFIDFIAPFVPPMLTALAQMAAGVFAWITAQAPGIITTLATWGVAFIDWIAPYIPGALVALGGLIAGIVGWIAEQMPAILATLQRWGEAFVAWVEPMIPPALAALGALAVGVLGWIGEQIPGILAQLETWANAFMEWVGPATTQLLTTLGTLATAVLGWLTEQAPTFLERLIAEWIPSFVDWVATAIPKVVKALEGIGTAIGTWIATEGPKLKTAADALGAAIVQGIQAGVTRLAGALIGQLTALGTQALDAAKKALGVASPSKRFRDEVGKPMVEGWVQGIRDESPALFGEITKLGQGAVTAGQKSLADFGKIVDSKSLGALASGASGGSKTMSPGKSYGDFGAIGKPIYPYIYPGANYESASPFGLGDSFTDSGAGKSLSGSGKGGAIEAETVSVTSTGPVKLESTMQQVQIVLNLPGGSQIVAMVLAEPPAVAALADGINQYNQLTGARGG
jgi:TP901 family phage tail tape measure protein